VFGDAKRVAAAFYEPVWDSKNTYCLAELVRTGSSPRAEKLPSINTSYNVPQARMKAYRKCDESAVLLMAMLVIC